MHSNKWAKVIKEETREKVMMAARQRSVLKAPHFLSMSWTDQPCIEPIELISQAGTCERAKPQDLNCLILRTLELIDGSSDLVLDVNQAIAGHILASPDKTKAKVLT